MSKPPFGIPGECMPHMSEIQEELGDAIEAGGDSAAYAFLDRAVAEGRLQQVVYDHIVDWNRAKQAGNAYVITHARFVAAHLDDWTRDGLPLPDPEDYDLSVFGKNVDLDNIVALDINLGPNLPVRVHRQGRNEPCACGSGRKYKVCHGRHP